MNWLNRIPLSILLIVALPLMAAPFPFNGAPHLVEKLQLLTAGELIFWADIGDLFLHGIPAVILATKLAYMIRRKPATADA